MRNEAVLIILLGVIFYLPMNAASFYLDYDNECMNRFSYVHTESDSGVDFIQYQGVYGQERLLMKVGQESRVILPVKPKGTLSCGALTFNKAMFEKINSGAWEVFIVRPHESGGYVASRVWSAEHIHFDGEFMTYSSPDMEFDYQTQVGKNAATGQKRQYFEAQKLTDCSKPNLLRWFDDSSDHYYDVYMVYKICAIIQMEWSGNKKAGSKVSEYTLLEINGHSVDAFIAENCSGGTLTDNLFDYERELPHTPQVEEPLYARRSVEKVPDAAHVPALDRRPVEQPVASLNDIPETYLNMPVPEVGEGMMIKFNAGTKDLTEKKVPVSEDYHSVKQGETLYGISRKHGVSLEHLARLNGINDISRPIRIGDKLRIR